MLEDKAMLDPVHMLLAIPPRYTIAMTLRYLKGIRQYIQYHEERQQDQGQALGIGDTGEAAEPHTRRHNYNK